MAKYRFSNVQKFQEGGPMPEEQGAPVEGGAPAGQEAGGDPMQQILQAAMQAVQSNDGNLALQVCGALVQMAQGGAPQQETAPEGQPVFKKGGILKKRILA